MMDWFFDKVEAESRRDGTSEKETAETLLTVFSQFGFSSPLPRGYWDVGRRGYEALQKEDVEIDASKGRLFFDRLVVDLFGEEPPKIFLDLKSFFEANSKAMLELAGLSLEEVRKKTNSQLPPYCAGLDLALKFQGTKSFCGDFPIEDIHFEDKPIGRGGYAEIYLGRDSSGKGYALKLFHPPQMGQGFLDPYASRISEEIISNVEKNRRIVSQMPFLKPLVIPPGNFRAGHIENMNDTDWYILEFCDGRDVRRKLHSEEGIDFETKAKVLLTYALMLESLHKEGMLFVDNNWGNVLVSRDGSVRICDYDLISKIEDLNAGRTGNFARNICNPRYCSREQRDTGLQMCAGSDLEGFALMIDHFFSGGSDTFLVEGDSSWTSALNNQQYYPPNRRDRLPKNIGDVAARMIQYPRDDSITARDFVSAIRRDFRV